MAKYVEMRFTFMRQHAGIVPSNWIENPRAKSVYIMELAPCLSSDGPLLNLKQAKLD